MEKKNISIKIEDVDEGQTVQRIEDIELGIGRPPRHKFGLSRAVSDSVEQLIPAEGKSPPSLGNSLRSSLNESKGIFAIIFGRLHAFLSTTKVFWLVVVYTVLGANLFMWLEVPTDLEAKKEAYYYHLVARDSLLFKVEQVHEGSELERKQHWKQAIIEFEQAVDCGVPSMHTQWTFWMAVLYCATIYTTVGYGNIACVTTGGRVGTIVYAVCGIPLMIVVLDQLGTFLLKKMKQSSNFVDDFMFYLGVRYHLVRLDNQDAFLRYIAICRTLARLRLIPSTITLTVTEEQEEGNNSPASSSSPSSASSTVTVGKGKMRRGARRDHSQEERRSLKIALSKGSLLDNLEPFQIESIVDPQSELAKRLLLLSPPPPPGSLSRRSSKTSTATIHFKLDEADDLLRRASPSRTSKVSSASAHSANGKEAEEEAEEEKATESPKSLGKQRRRSPPLLIALLATTGWISLAAAVFCLWEEWTYFTSVYFFFISMSTIGFGDITPQHPQYMIMSFFVVIVGLSLVSVCINVVQEKFSQIYMDFLNKMLQQYMKAQASGDVEALKGAMARFNQRCKYLMPFISKNQGIRLMNQFKEEARAMGVELPEVMTELSEETGKPAFCKIFDEKSDERVNQFLEKAQTQGKMRRNAHTQTKLQMQKTHKFFISRAEADKEEFQVQTEWAFKMDAGTQTPSSGGDFSDSGVQCQPWMRDVWTEWEAAQGMTADRWTTTTLAMGTRNTGVQPEVSCIMRIVDEGESDFAFSDYEEDEQGDISSSGLSVLQQMLSGSSREEEKMSVSSKRSLQMQRMAEMELSSIEGAKAAAGGGEGPLPPPKVTIRMASKATTEEEPAARDEGKKKEGRRRKMREGLRYMRNAAVQVGSGEKVDFGGQFGYSGGEEKGMTTEKMVMEVDEKGTQWEMPKMRENDDEEEEGAEEGTLSFETADDWRATIGAQTERRREGMKAKKTQTERVMMVSRPVQTQLTSTFHRRTTATDGEEGGGAMEGGGPEIAQIEAQGEGGMAEAQRERDELKRMFGLEEEEIILLREKMKEMKSERRRARAECRPSFTSSDSSEVESEKLTKEDKLILLEEIKKIRRMRRTKEEEEEEEGEGEVPKSVGQKGWRKVEGGGGGFVVAGEGPTEFTLQVSQPTRGGHILRENYEETILDIQLIRSPFFETKYLPQSEEQMIFMEAELMVKEAPPAKGRDKQRERREEEEGEMGKVDELLAKLERLDTICSALGEEEQMGRGEMQRAMAGPRRPMADIGGLEIGHFTAESAAQTDEEEKEEGGIEEATIGLAKLVKEWNVGMEELAEMVKKGRAAKGQKWTQTDWEDAEEEEEERRREVEEEEQRKKRVMEKEEEEGKEEKSGKAILTMEKVARLFDEKEEEEEEIISQQTSMPTGSYPPTQAKRHIKKVAAKEEVASSAKRMPSKLKGRKIKQMVTKFEGAEAEEKIAEFPLGQIEEGMGGAMMEGGTSGLTQGKAMVEGGGGGGGGTVPLDIAQIVLVQSQSTGAIEPMRIQAKKGPTGAASELVPLEAAELAKLAEIFPELVIKREEAAGITAKMKTPTALAKGGLEFVWQSSIEGRLKAVVEMEGGEMMIEGGGGGIGGGEVGGLKIIPLSKLLAGGSPAAQKRIKMAEILGGEEEMPCRPSSTQSPSTQIELEYYRRWLENMFGTVSPGAQFPLYDIPLRDISEFVRLKKEELSQLEKQKRQMERMGELAGQGEKGARMVDVSIQTGVHSRVVQILGEDLSAGTSAEEIDYLTNPAFPIIRIALKQEEEEEGEGREDDKEMI